jgi:hypothetical protein
MSNYKKVQEIKWNMELTDNKDIKRVLINKAYEFGLIFEMLEHRGIIIGNGHHKAQEIADCVGRIFDRDKKQE